MRNRFNHSAESTSGTVMVDALVAVVITSLMIAIVMVSLRHSQKLLNAASNSRHAATVMKALLVTTPIKTGNLSGVYDGFSYQLSIGQADDKIPLCTVKVALSDSKQAKSYHISAMRWCQATP